METAVLLLTALALVLGSPVVSRDDAATETPTTPTGQEWWVETGKMLKWYSREGWYLVAGRLEQCQAACLASTQRCESGNYYPEDPEESGVNCYLSDESAVTTPEEFTDEDPRLTVIYFDRRQIVTTMKEEQKVDWWVNSGKILIWYVEQVLTLVSLEECQAACLASTDFRCLSGMYYPEDESDNCLLSSESAVSKPAEFTDEDPEVPVLYFDRRQNARTMEDASITGSGGIGSLAVSRDEGAMETLTIPADVCDPPDSRYLKMDNFELKDSDKKVLEGVTSEAACLAICTKDPVSDVQEPMETGDHET